MTTDRAAAFEQWSQGGGSPSATWEITRAEAAFVIGELRAKVKQAEKERDWEYEQRSIALSDIASQEAAIVDAEARLARVPALVEAARSHRHKYLSERAGDFLPCVHCATLADVKSTLDSTLRSL